MTLTTHPFECNYLRPHTLPTPCISSEYAEINLISERIASLDRHISELKTLRRALHLRSRQLHNMLSPICTLPVEVLSRIFEQLTVYPQVSNTMFHRYRACLSQASVLGSVSAHFRHVALGTPELWRRIPLRLTPETIDKAASMLQYCMTLAASANVSVFDQLDIEEARSAIDILLTPNTIQKIKGFELYSSARASKTWFKKLQGYPPPMLDTLSIKCRMGKTLDFGVFKNVTRLDLYGPCWSDSLTIIAPPSLQYLTAFDIPQRALVSLLYQSPNLVECFAAVHEYLLDDDVIFGEPLILNHLKRFTFRGIKVITSPTQVLLLPALESLSLQHDAGNEFIDVIYLCRNVSATLTTLKIHIRSDTVGHDDLHHLWRIPFPNLRELELCSSHQEPLLNAIKVLTLRVDEDDSTKPHYLPSLTSLVLRSSSTIEVHCVLKLLDRWRIGEARCLCVEVRYPDQESRDWSPELREELGSVVGRRQIDIIWSGSKVQPLVRGTSGALQKEPMD